jgi:uncharacterized protein (TIGR03790 family)
MRRVRLAVICVLTAAAALCQGPANVLLVVNRTSADSGAIAAYYSRRRLIPDANVCGIRSPAAETVSRDVYEQQIAAPILACLETPRSQPILYIVTTKGVPLRVEGTSGRNATAAAVDSELATLYLRRLGKAPSLEGPVPNPFFKRREAPFNQRAFPIYLVTRLAAYDVATVKRMIDDSLKASNEGRFVIDMKSGGDGDGASWLRDAAIVLPAARVVFNHDSEVVENQSGVIGYASWGSNDPARKNRFLHFQWLPGSIMTEFVSTNGRTFERPPKEWNIGPWRSTNPYHAGSPQTLSADYLDEGATGASGHVYEPYLTLAPQPQFLFPAYYSGRNLAESYYLSLPAVSWMNIVLGDPLCSLGRPR